MAEIVLRDLTKRFPNGLEAVKQLSLEIGEGELLVLVGPSGCGKTTALRMVAGLEHISSGDLFIDGRRMNDVPERDRDMAMVFQNYALYPHMTVAQNIGFSLKLSRRPRREIKQRVAETARLLAIDTLLDRRPKQLSGGQRQRVAMGRAIIREPRAFLMDEPLSNLDAKLRVQMRGEIAELQQRLGVTTLYVTHDQVEAMTMGQRVAVLREGELQQVDTPAAVYDRPVNLFVASFIGSPPMNLAQATVERENGSPTLRVGRVRLPVPRELGIEDYVGKSLVVGIRPEDVHEARDGGGVDATVERVESLGPTVLGYFEVDAPPPKADAIVAAASGEALEDAPLVGHKGTVFCATFAPRSGVRIGDKVRVSFDTERLHLFDPETEERVPGDTRSTPSS